MHIRERRGKYFFYLVFGLIPLSLWLWAVWPLSISSVSAVAGLLARVLGVVGVCFYAGNLLLSGRYKFFDRLFYGLDKLYDFHYRMGKMALYLLLGHVALILYNVYQETLWDIVKFFFDFTYIQLTLGKIAIVGMSLIIINTLFFSKRYSYEWLKHIHIYLGAFFFVGALHAYLIGSDIGRFQPLRWYVLTLLVLAFISWVWRTVLRRWLAYHIKANVTAVTDLNGLVTEVVMQPQQPVAFKAGQFIFVRFVQKGFPNEDHPFSITASPHEGQLRISAKAIGDFTQKLKTLKPGASALIQGPFGGFTYTLAAHKKQIWIAGGIGITPFIGMARTLRDTHSSEYSVDLFFSAQYEQDWVFKSELEAIVQQQPNINVHFWLTPRDGFISIEAITKTVSLADTSIFICGPAGMMTALIDQAKKRGVPESNIHSELFRLL